MEWKDFKLVESRTAFATALFLFCSLLFFSMLCLFVVVFATRNNNFLTSSSSRNTKMPHHTFYRMYDNIRYKYSYVVGETPIWSLTESVTCATHSHSSYFVFKYFEFKILTLYTYRSSSQSRITLRHNILRKILFYVIFRFQTFSSFQPCHDDVSKNQ